MGTRLNIVNAMLSAVGEGVQNTIESQHPSVLKALRHIEDKNEEFQVRGWWFNTENYILLKANAAGEVLLPDGLIELTLHDTVHSDVSVKKYQYVQRGQKVYDSVKSTYTIGRDIRASMKIVIPVEKLPAAAYHYLKNMCVYTFYEDDDGDLGKAQKLEARAQKSEFDLKVAELTALQPNVNDRPAVQALQYRPGGYSINPRWPGGRSY